MAINILSSCGIYAVCNMISGKAYIGQSMRLPNRQREHLVLLRRGKHYALAMQKDFDCLSETCFEFKVLEFCEVSVLTEREQHWIDASLSVGVYNVALTAGSTLGVLRSKETRAKMSALHIGKPLSEKTKARMQISQAANKDQKSAATTRQMAVPGARERQRDAITGTKATEFTKQKLSVSSLQMWEREGFKERLSVIQEIAQKKISHLASQRMKDKWANPSFKAQMIASRLLKKKQKLISK